MEETRKNYPWLRIILIGFATGYLSGIFAVGGGVIMVPALVAFAGFEHRRAAGTSLTAVIFPAAAGVITYVAHDHINWPATGLLVAGSVVGAQIGTYLLTRLPVKTVRWAFVGFLLISAVGLVFVVPSRDAAIDITALTGAGLVAIGFGAGILAGLVGVGGGVILVPQHDRRIWHPRPCRQRNVSRGHYSHVCVRYDRESAPKECGPQSRTHPWSCRVRDITVGGAIRSGHSRPHRQLSLRRVPAVHGGTNDAPVAAKLGSSTLQS